MSGHIETQESLGTGLERHVSRLGDLEQTINQFKQELPSLKRQCERFKTERASLLTEVTSLRSERDTLRLEVSHEYDRNTHLKEEYLTNDLEGQGKANRRIWMLEQQNADLKRDMDLLQVQHIQDVEKERNVSSGLRNRIGTLDEKRRRAQEALVDAEKREEKLKLDVEHYKSSRAIALDAQPDFLTATINKTNEASPRNALQKRPSNITLATPTTPTRSGRTPSAPPSTVKKRSTPLSPSSLAKRCSMLEDRYNKLKLEYDRLRAKYQEDIKHWKDWKAQDAARREEKKKRKEQRSSRKQTVVTGGDGASVAPSAEAPVELVPPSQESTTSQAPTSSQEPNGSQRVTRSQTKKRQAEEERLASDPGQEAEEEYIESGTTGIHVPKAPIDPTPMPPPSQNQRVTRHRRKQSPDGDVTPIPPARREQRVQTTPLSGPSGPVKKGTPAARVTPWLGSSTRPRSNSRSTTADPDPFDHEVEQISTPLKRYPSAALEGSKTSLVRDRGEGPASSLRRNALLRTFSTDLQDANNAETSRPRDSVSPVPDSVKKRRLDMEGLTPAQKAQERKRINKLTPSEKRLLYADYKGKGRYLPPDQLQKTVADEYTIDPKENGGVTYQYHDVKRGHAERKQMHGGDCECCADYYKEVGALPRYNAGPAWKDPSQREGQDANTMTEAQVREHRNKVSRHRETWIRPPTPPGYWEIAFPTTQAVAEQNERADIMVAEKETRIRREAAHRDSKWRKKE